MQAVKVARLGVALARRRPLPFSISFILTNRCNFRCRYCNIPAAAGPEMTTAELRAAIDELAAAGMARAGFSGGEISLRPDAPEVIAHARRLGLFTSMNTNGWLEPAELDALAAPLDLVVLSLDGSADAHDAVRRRPGSHARVLAAIDALRARGVAVATITVLGPWNLEQVPAVLDLASAHGFTAYFQPAHTDCFDESAGLHDVFDAELLHAVATSLEQARAAGRPLASSPAFVERLRQGPRDDACARCTAGRYFGTVLPDGRVVPCHLTSEAEPYLNGLEVGFARAFLEMPHPRSGRGCAVTPLQESDLTFGLHPSAVTHVLRQIVRGRRRAAPRG